MSAEIKRKDSTGRDARSTPTTARPVRGAQPGRTAEFSSAVNIPAGVTNVVGYLRALGHNV